MTSSGEFRPERLLGKRLDHAENFGRLPGVEEKAPTPNTEGLYVILRALGGKNYLKVYNGKAVDITLKNINDGKSFTSTLKRIGQHYCITLPECYGYDVGESDAVVNVSIIHRNT